VGVRVGVAYSLRKAAESKSEIPILHLCYFPRYARLYLRLFEVCGWFVDVKRGVGQLIVIDENNTFQLKLLFLHQNCRSHSFGRFVGVRVAWHPAETNLRCAGICMPNPSIVALIVSEISAFIGSDGQTGKARSTRLVYLIKNIYTLWGRKRFLLPVTYFPTNLVYPFTLQVTGIKTRKIAYHDLKNRYYGTKSKKRVEVKI